MKYWWIIQSVRAYEEHPNLVGCSLKNETDQPIHKRFSKIRKGDHVVYYATGDKVLIGIFEVISEMEFLRDDSEWEDCAIYQIRPAIMPTSGFFLEWKKLLFEPAVSFDLFPNKEQWPYKIWNRYIHPLSDEDYETIKRAILSRKYEMKMKKGFHIWPHWFRSQRASQLGDEYGFKEAHHKRFFGWKTFKKSMPELYAKTSMEELWGLMKPEKIRHNSGY